MTDYTVLAKFRNKENVNLIIKKLKEKGKTCYNFFDNPADPTNPDGDPEEQMKNFENVKSFYDDKHFQKLFREDLDGLKNAEKVIVLLPAGNSVHIEAGIAFGLNKDLILIGEPEKPDTLYLIFKERYKTVEDFLETIK